VILLDESLKFVARNYVEVKGKDALRGVRRGSLVGLPPTKRQQARKLFYLAGFVLLWFAYFYFLLAPYAPQLSHAVGWGPRPPYTGGHRVEL